MSYPVERIERIEQHLQDSSKLADEIENLIDRDVKRETLGQRILYWCARRIACYKIARAFGSSRLNAIFKMWQKRYYLSPKRWLPPKGKESGMIYSDEAKREAKIRRNTTNADST